MTREVPLSRGLVALVDDEDYDRVAAVGKWYADRTNKTHYARKNFWVEGRCTSLKMHTFITGWPYVDHANGDGLDNRRCNLRPATDAQNAQNRGMRSDNSSGFKGVHWHKATSRWSGSITAHGQRHYLGLFDTAIEAAVAYDAAAIDLFGPFARLNFPKENAA